MSSKLKTHTWLEEFEQKICNNGDWKWEHGVFGKEIVLERRWTVTNAWGKTKKDLKTAPIFAKHAYFATWLSRHKAASSSRQNTQGQKFKKKISKCFSRLEGLLVRESRAEPRKSLCNHRDWTFYSRKSRQNWPANSWLRLATWLTRDWVAKTGQKWTFEIFRF